MLSFNGMARGRSMVSHEEESISNGKNFLKTRTTWPILANPRALGYIHFAQPTELRDFEISNL